MTAVTNYFAEGDYLTTDARKGVMRDRAGTRMLALTSDFLLGLRDALEAECGPAADLVLRTCGRVWGRKFAERVEADLGKHHGQPLANEPLARFEACLAAAFSHHGWGRVRFDFSHHAVGAVVVAVRNPVMAGVGGPAERPADPLLAGVLAGLLGHFGGQDLDCVQTACQACGAPESLFVVGLGSRLGPVIDGPAEQRTHDKVLATLQTATGDRPA